MRKKSLKLLTIKYFCKITKFMCYLINNPDTTRFLHLVLLLIYVSRI